MVFIGWTCTCTYDTESALKASCPTKIKTGHDYPFLDRPSMGVFGIWTVGSDCRYCYDFAKLTSEPESLKLIKSRFRLPKLHVLISSIAQVLSRHGGRLCTMDSSRQAACSLSFNGWVRRGLVGGASLLSLNG